MDCLLNQTGQNTYACTHCGRVLALHFTPTLPIRVECRRLRLESRAVERRTANTAADLPCQLRGPQLRTVGGCCGTTGRPVFACQVHVECSLDDFGLTMNDEPGGPRLAVCDGCAERIEGRKSY